MKDRVFRTWRPIGLAVMVIVGADAQAQTQLPSAAPAEVAASPAAPAASVKLPYGVEDIIKLGRAQVNDDIIVKYIQGSGTIYTLGPQEIVRLRDQGVSDRVVTAMLDQRRPAPQSTAGAPSVSAPTLPPAPAYPEPAPAYAQGLPPGTQPGPASVPQSTVYVIPYPQATYAYYGYPGAYYYPYSYSPYYGGYYRGCWGSSVSFRYGRGGGYHGRYYH
jgi:hypothetical protein